MAIQFEDYTMQVIAALEQKGSTFLNEAGFILQRQAANNTRYRTGETASKWDFIVDDSNQECVVGNPLENAIWEEFGTGEFAYHGNGRKGGWYYQDDEGNWHHTYGKTPTRALHNAFITKKTAIIRRAEELFKEV